MEEKRSTALFEKVQSESAAVQASAAGSVIGPGLTVESFGHKLLRGKWLVLFSAALFALIAMMLGALQQPLYKTQTSLEVQSSDRNNLSSRSSEDDTSSPQESFLQTQIRIIESRSLQERALAKLSGAERARLLDAPRFWWERTPGPPVESIAQHISARPAEQAGIIDVTFLAPDAVAGAHFLNILTQELADSNVERTWHALQHNRQWTERQIEDLRRKWEQSEQVLAEYSQASGLAAQRIVIAKTAAAGQQLPVGKSAQEANDPRLRQLRTKLANLNRQIAQWQALYGPSGVAVQKLKSEATETAAAIRQRKLEIHPNATAISETGLNMPKAAPETRDLAIKGREQAVAHFNALQQEANSNRVIYQTTAARLKEASVATASQLGDISVVDPAIPVTTLATPNRFATGALGGFTGLLLGISFVAFRDRLSNTFAEPALLGHFLGLPILGAVPIDRYAQDGKGYDTINQEPALQINFKRDIRTAEAFRSIRSSILLGVNQKADQRRLAFTSAGASEGTTFVVANLGAALASAQRRVLLVDGNLRNPGLHKIFGADNDHGLADLLSRQISESSKTSRDVIRETQIPDLYLLSAGQAGARAPEILSSGQLPQVIREFAKGFDLVLIDCGPVLPYADARSLAQAVDGVVLIVKAGSTDRHTALEAREAIRQDGSPIIGAILTEWDAALGASA